MMRGLIPRPSLQLAHKLDKHVHMSTLSQPEDNGGEPPGAHTRAFGMDQSP